MLLQNISLQLSDIVVLCRDRLKFTVHYKRPVVAVHADELYKPGQILSQSEVECLSLSCLSA